MSLDRRTRVPQRSFRHVAASSRWHCHYRFVSWIQRAYQRMSPGIRFLACAPVGFAVAVAGCSSPSAPMLEQRQTLTASFLPAGTTLEAWRGGEGLCLAATWDAHDTGSGGCSFRDTPTGGRYMVGGTDTGFMYAYGPVSAEARTVRLNLADGTTVEARTAPLPSGLAKGRYFLAG